MRSTATTRLGRPVSGSTRVAPRNSRASRRFSLWMVCVASLTLATSVVRSSRTSRIDSVVGVS